MAGAAERPAVILTVDEYETLRLIDREGFSQQECGTYMGVGRTTVQLIYAAARKKVADALVDGLPLKIEGGDYRLCDGAEERCGCGGCERHRRWEEFMITGGTHMKIAVTYENGQVFQHFGHTEQFKIYDVEQNQVKSAQVADTNGSGHGALAGFLGQRGVNVLICGGIGGGARNALAQAGIEIYGGVSGDADQAVEALLAGALRFDPNAACSHHDGEHGHGHDCHDHGHDCHSHGCGEHSCGN